MKITKQRTNPSAYRVAVGGVEFVAMFETLTNNTNGHTRRSVLISWNDPRGVCGMCARSFVIVLHYESEQEATEELARRIVDSWKK